MTIGLTATDLAEPRYLAQVRRVLAGLGAGRLEVILPDGRSFVAEGAAPGPQAVLRLRDNDVFARLIREGELGFCDAYLDGDWDTPDLMAFRAWGWCEPMSGCGIGCAAIPRRRRGATSPITMIWGMISMASGWMRP